MLKTKQNIFLFLFSLILTFSSINSFKIKSLTFSEFSEEVSEYEVQGGITYKVSYTQGEITQNYIRITAFHEESENVFMYFSHISDKRSDAAFLSTEYKDSVMLYISKGFITEQADGTFYLSVGCFGDSCSYELEVITMDEIDFARDASYSYYVTDKKNTQNTFKMIRTDTFQEKGYLTFWATGNKNIKMSVKYYNENSGEVTEIPVTDLPLGKICFFKEEDYPIGNGELIPNAGTYYFLIEITANANTLVTVGSKTNIVDSEEGTITPKKLRPNSKEILGILTNEVPSECYDFDITSGSSQKFYLSIIAYLQSIDIQLKSKTTGEISESFLIPDGMDTIEINSNYYNSYVCLTKNTNSIDKAPFSFQLTDKSQQGNYQNLYAPQANGYFYVRYLEPGQTAFYTGLPSKNFVTEFRYNLKVLSGFPKMYFVKCSNYPKCDLDDISNLPEDTIEPHDVNGMFTYSLFKKEITSPVAGDQYVLLAYCQKQEGETGTPCKFETSFFSEKDSVNLRENVRFYQTITSDGLTEYKISLFNQGEFSQIFVNFLTFSGTISIKYSAENYLVRNYLAGNKQYFVIDKNSQGQEMAKEIYFYVTGELTSNYAVDYKLIRSDEDKRSMKEESGISYLETIEPKVGYKTITLTNKRVADKKNFLINFFSLNCQISVKRIFNQKETDLKIVDYLAQDVFIRTEETASEYDLGEYSYRMKIEKMDNVTKFDQNWCMVYVSSVEQNDDEENFKQKQLTVSEGVVNQVILSSNFPKIQYIYPHSRQKGHVVINFNMETESKLKVKIFLENKLYDELNMAKSRYYILKENDIRSEEYCPVISTRPNQVCNVIVQIELDENFYSDEPIIEFNIKSKEIVPAFVRKSMLRQDVIVGNFYQYYFTEVGKKEEGQVIVNFNRGSGHIFGRLVPKDAEEGEGWMGRFILPDEGNNELRYNHYTKKLMYGEMDTEQCEVGCYLLLKVAHNMTDDDFIKEDIGYPISISIHANDATILEITSDIITSVDIPINEYIVGSTVPLWINTLNDYYTFFIPYDCEELIFELQSDSCKLQINIGNEKPTKDVYDYSFGNLGEDSVFHLKKSEILSKLGKKQNEGSIKNVELTIGVAALYIDDESSSIYSFRIRARRENELDIIQLTSDQKALCDIKGTSGNCYFLVAHQRKIDSNNNFFFYSIEEPNLEYAYYANIVDPEVIISRDQGEIKKILPVEGNAQWSSKNMMGNYLYIDNEDIENKNNGVYILVNLEVKAPLKKEEDITIIRLLNSVYSYKGITLPDPTSNQLFSVKANPVEFNFLTENQNIIAHIVCISGGGQVFWEDYTSSDNPRYYLNNPGDSVDLTLGTSDNFPLQIISMVSSQKGDPGFGIFVSYKIQSLQENYNKVFYGQSTKISFKDADFPFIFYTKIPDKSHEVDFILKLDRLKKGKIIKTKINNNLEVNDDDVELLGGDEFELTGVVTEEELIYEKKGNHYINPPDKNKILGIYDPATKVGRIQFTPAKIEKFNVEGNNYLYVIISKAVGNGNNYKEVSMECSVQPSNKDGFFPPINKYNYAKIPVGQEGYSRYELNRVNNRYKFMRIEFATNTEKINFALNNHVKNTKTKNDINYYKNNTEIVKEEIYGGKSSIIIEFTEDDISGIYLSVFNIENSKYINEQEKLSNFLFRYNLSDINSFTQLRPENKKVNYTFDKNVISIQIPAIKGMFDMLDVNYYAKFLPSRDMVKNENLGTIAQVESKTNKIFKKSVINYNRAETMNITDITNDRIYYLVILAEVFEEDEAQFFAFDAIYNPTGYVPKTDSNGSNVLIWVIIAVIFFVFILILIFVFLFLKVKKENFRLSQQFNELNNRLQSQNVIIDS